MRQAELVIGYKQRGDDLASHIATSSKPVNAIHLLQAQLRGVISGLDELIIEIGDADVRLMAGTHYVGIEGPEALINRLIAKGLAR